MPRGSSVLVSQRVDVSATGSHLPPPEDGVRAPCPAGSYSNVTAAGSCEDVCVRTLCCVSDFFSASISPRVAWWIGFACELIYTAFRRETEPPITRFIAEQLSTAHWYDISAAHRDFGFRPEFSIEQGLQELAKSFE